jgi:hypothetical protein
MVMAAAMRVTMIVSMPIRHIVRMRNDRRQIIMMAERLIAGGGGFGFLHYVAAFEDIRQRIC